MVARKSSPKQHPIRLFSLYAQEDAPFYKKFEKHLSSLKHQGSISLTSMENINPGTDQEAAIKKELDEAQIILCFLSADFLNSPLCQIVECALEQLQATQTTIAPILLREVDIEGLPLSKLQALPSNARAVTVWRHKDQAFACIAKELRALVAGQMKLPAKALVVTDDHLHYLHWLIQRLSYLSMQSTHPHQTSFQVKLEEIYVPIQVRKVEASSSLASDEEEPKQTENDPPLPFPEAAFIHSHLLLLGEPGSGKTMCLQELALRQAQQACQKAELNDEEIQLPILLRLADFVEYGMHQGKSLSEYLAEDGIRHGCPVSSLAELLHTALQAGRCLVLLDGLDEVGGTDASLAVVQQIEKFASQYKNAPNRLIITSRFMIYDTIPFSDTFVRYRLCKLDESHILDFLQAWYPATQTASLPGHIENREVRDLYEALQKVPTLHQLATNPLFLRMLAQLYQARKHLPQQRAALYAQMTQMLFQTERLVPKDSGETKVSWQLNQSSITDLLGRLGFWLHGTRPGRTVSEQEIFEQWRSIWHTLTNQQRSEDGPQLEQALRHPLRIITDRTGILVEEFPGQYRFAHLTFEEYFAACHLVAEKQEQAKHIRNHLHEAHWQEPILLALGLIGMKAPEETHLLVESVLLAEGEEAKARGITPSPYEHLLGRDFLFALRCLGDNILVSRALAERLIERLYNELAYDAGSGRFFAYRDALIERWREIETSIYATWLLPHILKNLKASDSGLRRWSAYCLRDMRHSALQEKEQIFQRLREALDDEERWVRSAVLQSLHDLNSPDLIDILLDRLRNDNDWFVRKEALHYLGEMEVRSANLTETLLQILRQTASDSGSSLLYWDVAKALGQLAIPSPAVISTLIELLLPPAGTGTNLNHAILESLRELSSQSSEVVPMIVNAIQGVSEAIHYEVFRALRTFNLSTQRAAEAFLLYTVSMPHTSWYIRPDQLLDQLEELSERAEKALQQFLQSEIREVRMASLDMLCAFELSETTFEIMSQILLTDADLYIRTHIIRSMGSIEWSIKDRVSILLQVLQDPDEHIRSCAVEILGNLAPTRPPVLTALLSALNYDPSWSVRYSVVRCFQEMDKLPKRVHPVLVQALTDEDISIRQYCAQLLGQHGSGNTQTIQALIKGLSDKYESARESCSQALVLLGQRSPQCKPTIMKLLEHCIQTHQNNEPFLSLTPSNLAFQALWHLSNDVT